MKNSIRLLIVEDSEDDSALVLLLLRQAGYEVYSERAESANGLARALNQKSPRMKVLLSWDRALITWWSKPHNGTFAPSRRLRLSWAGETLPSALALL